MSGDFSDLAYFDDSIVNDKVRSLIADDDFLKYVAGYLKPTKWGIEIPNFITPYFVRKRFLKNGYDDIDSVDKFHQIVWKSAFEEKFRESMNKFDWSFSDKDSLENKLESGEGVVFLSNHRNIVADPFILGYVLNDEFNRVPRFGIGDNLFSFNHFFEDIARLSGCFKVKRDGSLSDIKQMSRYISHIVSEGEMVWLAQRSGRSIDFTDKTQEGVLKMLKLGLRSSKLEDMNIVPVTISYQFEPTEFLLAARMALETRGVYEKHPMEDEYSIRAGLIGSKGDVHVHFGDVMSLKNLDAKGLDDCIHDGLKIYGINLGANQALLENNRIRRQLGLLETGSTNFGDWYFERIKWCDNASDMLKSKFGYDVKPLELLANYTQMYANPYIMKGSF